MTTSSETKMSFLSSKNLDPPHEKPDNGKDPTFDGVEIDSGSAWRVAVGASLAVTIVYGLTYSYGQFFKPMAQTFGAKEAAGSIVFSITSLLGFGLSALTGPIADRFGARPLLVTGALSLAVGLSLTAKATSLWQAYLCYGLGMGIGLGCVYVPALATVGRWFRRYRALATGLVVTGVGVGTFAGPLLSAWLIAEVGWRTAYIYYAVSGAAMILMSAVLISRPPVSLRAAMAEQDGARRGFAKFYAAALLINVVIYVPYVHLSYAAQRIGIDALAAASLVSAIGISNIMGRLAVAGLATRIGPLVMFKLCHLGLGLSFFVWLAANGYMGFLAFAVLIGVNHGIYSALIPVVLAEEFGSDHIGKMLGILFTALGIGSAIGPPLTGYFVEITGGYALALWVLALIGLLGAAVLMRYRTAQPAQ